MAPEIVFVPATIDHAEALAPVMRSADVAEVLALGFPDSREAVVSSLGASDVAGAMLFDGEVAALFGVATVPGTNGAVGEVWLLTGDSVTRHPRGLLRWSREVLRVLLESYGCLINLIDARYLAALRWAKWLGFEVGEPRPHGPFDLPFCPITIRRTTWAH